MQQQQVVTEHKIHIDAHGAEAATDIQEDSAANNPYGTLMTAKDHNTDALQLEVHPA